MPKRLAKIGLDKNICRVIFLPEIVAESFRHAPGVGARGSRRTSGCASSFSFPCLTGRFLVLRALGCFCDQPRDAGSSGGERFFRGGPQQGA